MIDPGTLNLMIVAENSALAIGNRGGPFVPFEGLEDNRERPLAGGNNLLSLD